MPVSTFFVEARRIIIILVSNNVVASGWFLVLIVFLLLFVSPIAVELHHTGTIVGNCTFCILHSNFCKHSQFALEG